MRNKLEIHLSSVWQRALKDEIESDYFFNIFEFIKKEKNQNITIFPPEDLIFQAFNSVVPQDIKVVIIGQDPYHNNGEAMGLSFSVPGGIKVPPSLKNVYKELQNDVDFIPPMHGDLTGWADQGVFLLNSILTVEYKKPGSHKHIGWQAFTDATIKYLSRHFNHIVFLLWGNFAKTKKNLIDTSRHLVLEGAHPSPLARNAFQGCRHFSQANDYLLEKGRGKINWTL